jgi:signal transduction histidine kinase
MLHDFIVQNRERIIERARTLALTRAGPDALEAGIDHGVPTFLVQLTHALRASELTSGAQELAHRDSTEEIGASAELHGHDLLRSGFTIAEVVHGYGDVCQIVTELASEADAAISPEEFHVFNRCLDDAIAGAVTAYGRERELSLARAGAERSGVLVHELASLVNTAVLSFDIIKQGLVGLSGNTAQIHGRSLAGLRTLVERALAQVRLDASVPKLERIPVATLVREVAASAALHAGARNVVLTVDDVASNVSIDAERELLTSALSNLLQNALKFTRPHGHVAVATRATADRVFIDVSDECGGLPPGKAEELFRPFARAGTDRSGLGLGLSIALSAVRANAGTLSVRDIPEKGCVFTIELPRVGAVRGDG